MFSSIRMIFAVLLITGIAGAGMYVMKLRADNATLKANQIKLGGYKIGEEDDVFASSDYIKVIYSNNDKKDFYGYEANNGAITLFINEVK